MTDHSHMLHINQPGQVAPRCGQRFCIVQCLFDVARPINRCAPDLAPRIIELFHMFGGEDNEAIGGKVFDDGAIPRGIGGKAMREDHKRIGCRRAIHCGILEGLPLHYSRRTNFHPWQFQHNGIVDFLFHPLWVERRIPETGIKWMIRAFIDDKRLIADPKRAVLGIFRCIGAQPHRRGCQ